MQSRKMKPGAASGHGEKARTQSLVQALLPACHMATVAKKERVKHLL
jgi:hypothetical protein